MRKHLIAYLYNRPFFYSFIRPKELQLFNDEKPFRKPVLDFGCGDGFFANALFGKKKIEVGSDINKNILPEAIESGSYEKVIIINGNKIPLRNSYFSTVVSNCVLEHVKYLKPVLEEIRRVMKRDGKFYLTVMTDKWEDFLIGGTLIGKKYKRWMKRVQKHPNLLSESNWKKNFKAAGFKVINEVGYIDKKTSHLIEIFHFLSIDSLITHKFFKKWVLFPQRFRIIESRLLKNVQKNKIPVKESAAIFYILEK